MFCWPKRSDCPHLAPWLSPVPNMGDGSGCSYLLFREPPHLNTVLTLLPVQQEERNNLPGAQVCLGHKQCELVFNAALYDLEGKKIFCTWQILFQ